MCCFFSVVLATVYIVTAATTTGNVYTVTVLWFEWCFIFTFYLYFNRIWYLYAY